MSLYYLAAMQMALVKLPTRTVERVNKRGRALMPTRQTNAGVPLHYNSSALTLSSKERENDHITLHQQSHIQSFDIVACSHTCAKG